MANSSKTTKDHDEIRKWAEERGGKPSHVKATGAKSDPGILRIDFPGYSGEGSLEEISWDEFFEKFDEQGLSFLYQEETAGGERSNFNKLVSTETADENESRGSATTKSSRKKTPVKTAAKKTLAKKAVPVKKAASKKSSKALPAKKTAAKKSSVSSKKGTTKKTPVKKAVPAKTSKKASAKKSTGKTPTKKSAAKKRR